MSSKKVTIKREYSFAQQAQSDPEVQEYLNMSYRAIGAYWKITGRIHATGLTREEEALLLPHLIGIYPGEGRDGVEFNKAVQNFAKNINTKIPAEGLTLEIGLEKDGEPFSTTNFPLNVHDYVIYKHAINHPLVGENKEIAEKYGHIIFYIEDKDAEFKSKDKVSSLEDTATAIYLGEIKNDPRKAAMVLTLLGENISDKAEPNELFLKLKSYTKASENLSDDDNVNRINKFMKIAKDKTLANKYEIMQLISIGVLERVGTAITIRESGEKIGANLKEAVLWMQDKGNSRMVNIFRTRLNELGKPVFMDDYLKEAADEQVTDEDIFDAALGKEEVEEKEEKKEVVEETTQEQPKQRKKPGPKPKK